MTTDEDQGRDEADRVGRLEVDAYARQSSSILSPDKAGDGDHCGSPIRRLGSQDAEIYTETGRAEMSTYAVFFEPTATGYSAHVPDLPGCVAAASTLGETRQLIREAIEFHIEGMRMNGDVVPEPTPHIEQLEVSA